MPPQLALLLCIFFILAVFILDFKRKPNVSYALWIPLIWLMIIGSRPVSFWLDVKSISQSATMSYVEGNPTDRFIAIMFLVVGVFILSRRKTNLSQILQNNMWLFFLILYGAISILWSDFPFVSFKRWIKSFVNYTMVLIVLTDVAPFEAVMTMMKRCSYLLIPMSIVLIKYFPHMGMGYGTFAGEPHFLGVTNAKNSLGALCFVCGFFLAYNLIVMWGKKNISVNKKEVFVNILLLLMVIWLFKKLNSATSLICLIIGICVIIGIGAPTIRKNLSSIGKYIFLSLLFCLIILFLFGFNNVISSMVDITGHSDTFWGRTILWGELVNMGTNPLIGSGFECFWLGDRLATLWEMYWWHPNQAHNGYLETYLNLGLFGLVLLLGFIVSAYRKIIKVLLFDIDYGRLQMGLFAMVLVYNTTEAAFKGLHLVWFVFLLSTINCGRLPQYQKINTN